MRLESYNAAPFEFEPLHADADAAAQDTLPPETPADSGMPPPVADEAPGELLRKLALHPLNDKGLDAFLSDWRKTGQTILQG